MKPLLGQLGSPEVVASDYRNPLQYLRKAVLLPMLFGRFAWIIHYRARHIPELDVTHDYRVVAKLEDFGLYLPSASLLPTSTIYLSTVPLLNRPIRVKSFEGNEERCQVELRADLYRSIGLVVVLSSYSQV